MPDIYTSDFNAGVNDKIDRATREKEWSDTYLSQHCHLGMSYEAKVCFLTLSSKETGLTAEEACMINVLSSFSDGQNGDIYPSIEQLAYHRGISTKTVKKILTALTKKGWLRSHQPNRNSSAIREVLIPEDVEARIQEAIKAKPRKKLTIHKNSRPGKYVNGHWMKSAPTKSGREESGEPGGKNRGAGREESGSREGRIGEAGVSQSSPLPITTTYIQKTKNTEPIARNEFSGCSKDFSVSEDDAKSEPAIPAPEKQERGSAVKEVNEPSGEPTEESRRRVMVSAFLWGGTHAVGSMKRALGLESTDDIPEGIMAIFDDVKSGLKAHDKGNREVMTFIETWNSQKNDKASSGARGNAYNSSIQPRTQPKRIDGYKEVQISGKPSWGNVGRFRAIGNLDVSKLRNGFSCQDMA